MQYMGSKRHLAKHFLPIILQNRSTKCYVEPFAGGHNMIDKVQGLRIANDLNYYVISLFHAVCSGWVPHKVTKQQYEYVKKNRQHVAPWIVGWVGIGCSFSGKWFGGFAGTRISDGWDYQEKNKTKLLEQAKLLKGTFFQSGSYLNMWFPIRSVIYCDPPYQETTGYSSTFDHLLFFDWCRIQNRNGHTVFVSEYNAPKDFVCVCEIEKLSNINQHNNKEGIYTTERLFRVIG